MGIGGGQPYEVPCATIVLGASATSLTLTEDDDGIDER